MYNSCLTNMDFNVGIYIRLSQEDKDNLVMYSIYNIINMNLTVKVLLIKDKY